MVLPSRRTLFGTVAGVGAVAAASRFGPSGVAPEAVNASPFTDARSAGAAGDGQADDAPALNAAIQSLAAAGGGVLWLPRGTYRLGSSLVLQSGVSVISGATGHGYTAGGRAAAVVLQASDDLQDPVVDTGDDVVSAHLSGVDVRGNGRTTGIRLRKASWCSVTACSVDACGGPGLLLEAGMACVLEDLLLTNCVLDRSVGSTTGALDVAGTDHYVSRCEAAASLKAKSSADKRVAAAVLHGANHFVADSVGEYSDIGWVVNASSSRLTGVRADTNFGDGFVVTGSGNAFAACTSNGNSQDTAGSDDGWVVTGTGNAFAACMVVTPPGTRVRHGFRDTANASAVSARNTYAACTVDDSAAAPWQTEGFLGSSPSLAANAIRPAPGTSGIDVAQAGLVVLFDWDQAATIRSFDNGVDGQTLRVLGSRAVTIAASDTIRTSSGLPILMAVDSVVSFTHYDGIWYQVA